MRKFLFFSRLMGILLISTQVNAQRLQVNALRFWKAPDSTRMVFDVSSPPEYKLFILHNPERLVIDFTNTRLAGAITQPPADHSLFARIRSAGRNQHDLRVVVDLKNAVKPNSFSLKPYKTYGHRLVVDLLSNENSAAKQKPPKMVKKTTVKQPRDIVIAIDAGHGGEDPGARGPHGTQEKKVVLAIAQKLGALIKKQAGMKPVMVRDGDYYVPLRKRMQIARTAKADLFVSIHADAFKNSRVKGASVFTLSSSGASSEAARWLAKNENAADLIGGVSLDDKDDVLASVLLDLSQTATKDASQNVAREVLKHFKRIGPLHSNKVQKAGFVVLKSPDMPSILVETAFISNPEEARKLRSGSHQIKMANAIYKGILAYFRRNPLPGTRMAASKHLIVRGETLSGIAQQYGVSMKQLIAVNSLSSTGIRAGQVISIPAGS